MKGGLKNINMNKKITIIMLSVFAIGLVVAGAAYYGVFSASFEVLPSIILSGTCDDTLGVVHDGDTVVGSECTLTNDADSERDLRISNNATEGIEVSYKGTLTLGQKNLNTWVLNGDTKTINYTIIGDEFEVDVPEGYTLIYYPNTEGDVFTTNVANSIVLVKGINDIENLPIELDVGDDYCGNGNNYAHNDGQCIGAKLWLIEGDETAASAKLNSWTASEFYFETELIQYNAEGEITLSPGASLTIIPVYEIGVGVNGTQEVTTTIE